MMPMLLEKKSPQMHDFHLVKLLNSKHQQDHPGLAAAFPAESGLLLFFEDRVSSCN